jgi:hypothetical protein
MLIRLRRALARLVFGPPVRAAFDSIHLESVWREEVRDG